MSTSARLTKRERANIEKAKMKSLKTELDEFKARSKAELEMQKTAHENALAAMKLDLESLKAENEKQLAKLTFLKVSRDLLEGDVTVGDPELDGTIEAHRIILASKSEVMLDIFESQKSKRLELHLELPEDGASHSVVEAMVNFCYTGEIVFTESVPPEEVLTLAAILKIEHLGDVCYAELCRRNEIENVRQMLETAAQLSPDTSSS